MPRGASAASPHVIVDHSGLITNRTRLSAGLGAPPDLEDAELLRRLYAARGPAAARELEGTASWVLWDGEHGELVLVRDRLGTNTLYVCEAGGAVAIAPRMSTLLAALPARPDFDTQAMVAQIQGQALPPGRTFFAGVRQVEPASMVVVGRTAVREERYWEVGEALASGRIPEEAAPALLRECLAAVVLDYASPQPSGITLSSGLDSPTVAALLRAALPAAELGAVSWLAPELPAADESAGIELISRSLGLRPVPIRADGLWPLGDGVDLAPPLAGPRLTFYSRLWRATFEAARAAGLSVLFTGASGDHLVGGRVSAYADLLLLGRFARLGRETAEQARRSGQALAAVWRHHVLGPLLRSFLPPAAAAPLPWLREPYRDAGREAVPPGRRPWLPGRRQRLELLRDRTFPRVLSELTSQGAELGIEVRHPLADHRLFELAARLPSSASFVAGVRKVALRRAMAGALPAEILAREGKVFPTAIAERGLREREAATVRSLMREMRAADLGLVDPAVLAAHTERYLSGAAASSIFWHTLTLEAWLRAHGG